VCTKCTNTFPAGSRITEFDGKQYHPECFACVDCRKAITSQFYPFNNDYLCGTCHEQRFPRKRCAKCNSVITSAVITFAGASYHAACFLCMYPQLILQKKRNKIINQENFYILTEKY
ncbi:unnamed protein product, partial [Rotaria sp. Silwood2]